MGKTTKPIVRDAMLWTNGQDTAVSTPIPIESPQWVDWLSTHKKFEFKGSAGHFTARRECRHGSEYWYAYRRREGKLYKAYLGKSSEVTLDRLIKAAANLAGKTVLTHLSLTTNSPPGSPIEPWTINTSFSYQAKIRPPTLPLTLVTRPRLTSKISTAVTFISAPSGFGKSTLLNVWRQGCGEKPVAWATLDAEDDHLLRFWTTVVMALQTVHPGLGQNLMPFLQPPSSITPAEIVALLSNELPFTEGEPFSIGLVLDDFHHIKQADVQASMQIWLEHLPPGLQLIIAGRTRPPLALGRLRAMGLMTELDLDDLRFTLPEGIAFLQQHVTEKPLAYGDMETLVNRTGGWVAGLKLAVLVLNKQQDQRQVIDSFSGAHLFLREYFMETVLHQRSTAVQTFLLKTSILKQLTGGLCNAVTGQTNGGQMLERLWQENLFIIRSDKQDWYRYHDLFAEMLRSQLQRQFPEEIPDLHRRAAAWYGAQNMSTDAVRHLLFIEDWEAAAAVIEDVCLHELAELGEDSRLLRWVQQLPESVMQRHKTLLFVYLRLATLALPRDAVIHFLQRIENNLTLRPQIELTQNEREVLDEVRHFRHRITMGTAVSQLTAGKKPDERWQLLDAFLITDVYQRSKTDEVEVQFQEIYNRAWAEGNLFVTLFAGSNLAGRAFVRGELRQSEKLAYQVLQYALTQRGELPEPASITLSVLSQVALCRNELTKAYQFLDQATAVDPNPTSTNMPVTVAIIRAKLQSAEGDHAEARATIQAARSLQEYRPTRVWCDQDLAAYEARFCGRQGNWREAALLLEGIQLEEAHAISVLVQAEILLNRQEAAAAEAFLNHYLAKYPAGMLNDPPLEARLLLVLSLFRQHKLSGARQLLVEAVRQAAPEQFIRPFLDHGNQLVPLMVLVLHTQNLTNKSQEFIHRILQLLGYSGDAENILPKETLTALAATASITPREQDVLRLVHAGLSNRQIGDKLCISPGTVKTHLTNIYGKLDVNSRVQAVAKAQSFNLIQTNP